MTMRLLSTALNIMAWAAGVTDENIIEDMGSEDDWSMFDMDEGEGSHHDNGYDPAGVGQGIAACS